MIVHGFARPLSLAVASVSALDEHLSELLGYADVLWAEGHEASSNEVRRSLMRAITALRVLKFELVSIELVERLSHSRSPPS